MIYVCIPSRDEAETIGLLLWKIRKAFESLGREYHLIVGDDGSKDHTGEVLDLYAKVTPLTVHASRAPKGYAAMVERLLGEALELSDRPKRDAAIVMHGDFAHSPEFLADFVRKLDSGADIVVGEGTIDPRWTRGYRWTRKWSRYLLGKSAGVPGVADPTTGFTGYRLAVLKAVLDGRDRVLESEGWAANAELLGRAAAHARRIETVPVAERHDLKSRPSRVAPWPQAKSLWRLSRTVREAIRSSVPPANPAAPRGRSRREKGAA